MGRNLYGLKVHSFFIDIYMTKCKIKMNKELGPQTKASWWCRPQGTNFFLWKYFMVRDMKYAYGYLQHS